MKMYTPLILVAAFSPIVFGNIIVEGYGAADNIAAGIANFGNTRGRSLNALTSGTFNAVGNLVSGATGSGKKPRDLEQLLVRSLQDKLLARAMHDRLASHSPGVHQLRDLEALYSRSMNNIFARSDKPKPAHTGLTGASDNIGAGVANFGNAQGSSATVSGKTNAVGTLASGGSGAVKTASQNHNKKPANNGKKSRDFEDLLVRSIILARSMHGVSSRSDKPKPNGVTGASDNLGAGIANFGNAQGSSFDATLSRTFNSIGTLLSGVTGSGAVNTAFQNSNNKPADGGKKSRDLHDLLVRSIQDKLFLSSARP